MSAAIAAGSWLHASVRQSPDQREAARAGRESSPLRVRTKKRLPASLGGILRLEQRWLAGAKDWKASPGGSAVPPTPNCWELGGSCFLSPLYEVPLLCTALYRGFRNRVCLLVSRSLTALPTFCPGLCCVVNPVLLPTRL